MLGDDGNARRCESRLTLLSLGMRLKKSRGEIRAAGGSGKDLQAISFLMPFGSPGRSMGN